MQKEGKMLINKEQNQVYVILNRHTTRSCTFISIMNSFFPLLNNKFSIFRPICSNFVR